MTAYQQTHQRTAWLHYEGSDYNGRQIVVDVAEITPGRFTVAALDAEGNEIESDEVEDLDTARRLYGELFRRLTEKPRNRFPANTPSCGMTCGPRWKPDATPNAKTRKTAAPATLIPSPSVFPAGRRQRWSRPPRKRARAAFLGTCSGAVGGSSGLTPERRATPAHETPKQ